MNSPYSASRSRSFPSRSAWALCVRCVSQVATLDAAAPTRDPAAAATGAILVESMVACSYLCKRSRRGKRLPLRQGNGGPTHPVAEEIQGDTQADKTQSGNGRL